MKCPASSTSFAEQPLRTSSDEHRVFFFRLLRGSVLQAKLDRYCTVVEVDSVMPVLCNEKCSQKDIGIHSRCRRICRRLEFRRPLVCLSDSTTRWGCLPNLQVQCMSMFITHLDHSSLHQFTMQLRSCSFTSFNRVKCDEAESLRSTII